MPELTADRHLPFASGCFNVRDLGGLTTGDGLVLRRRQVFRADGLHRLPPEDVEQLAAAGVRTVVDLRSGPELRTAPSIRREGIRVLHLPVLRDVWPHDAFAEAADRDPVAFLVDRYVEMLEQGAAAIAAVFALLADADARPLAFHCSAGKDRTGVVAALLLDVLGVDDDVIADDYARSADAMGALVAWIREHNPEAADAMADQPAAFLSCPADAMHGFLARLRDGWGSGAGYLGAIGVEAATIGTVRSELLEDRR